jgi:deazaflavin-dependent oxidoreductase (nitroreductase family)
MNPHDSKPETQPGSNTGPDAPRVFPLPGTTYYNMLYDPKSKKRYLTGFKIINAIIVPLYRLGLLPLLGFGKLVLLLTTRGRISGKLRQTPIGYFRYNDTLHLTSGWGTEANWYKNILAYPDQVYVQVGFHHFHARAELLHDQKELQQMMKWLLKHHTSGMEAKAMGWDPKRDNVETADFSGMFEKMAIIRLNEQS